MVGGRNGGQVGWRIGGLEDRWVGGVWVQSSKTLIFWYLGYRTDD